MFRTLFTRRCAEDARVDSFVAAIRRSADQPAIPLQREATDTVAFPRIILAGTVLGMTLALTGCGSTPAPSSATVPASTTTVPAADVQPVIPQLDGTDAGLITEPAPSVQELEAQDAAAVPVRTPEPVPVPQPVQPVVPELPAPVVEEPIMEPQFPEFGEQYDVVTETTPADGQ
jgi:hypothetical protein